MEQERDFPENDIPRMQDLIKRKTTMTDVLYADLFQIYDVMPSPIKKLAKGLKDILKGRKE